MNAPVIIDEEILDMSDFTVAGENMITGDLMGAPQIGIVPASLGILDRLL